MQFYLRVISGGQLVLDVEKAHELFVESIVDGPWQTHPHEELEGKLTLISNYY